MQKHKIDFSHCPVMEDGGCPTSVVILSMNTGSRTIIHQNQNNAEITLQDFEKLNLEDYSWVHFEVCIFAILKFNTLLDSLRF